MCIYEFIYCYKLHIYILLVIDEDLKYIGPTFGEMASKIKRLYQKKTAPNVKIIVKEVEEIKDDPDTGKHAPVVVSYVNINDACRNV